MAGQGQQEAVEGRGVGPRRGPLQHDGGRRPVAEEVVGRPELASGHSATGSALSLVKLVRNDGNGRFVTDRRNRPRTLCGDARPAVQLDPHPLPAPVPIGGSVWKTAQWRRPSRGQIDQTVVGSESRVPRTPVMPGL